VGVCGEEGVITNDGLRITNGGNQLRMTDYELRMVVSWKMEMEELRIKN